jgi:hypothetical protein
VKIRGISTVVHVNAGTALTFQLELYIRISNHVCRRFSGLSETQWDLCKQESMQELH